METIVTLLGAGFFVFGIAVALIVSLMDWLGRRPKRMRGRQDVL